MSNKPKFKIGDKVRIINYVHPLWIGKKSEDYKLYNKKRDKMKIIYEDEDFLIIDINPDALGTIDVIKDIDYNFKKYSLTKSAWYNEEQLELVK